MGQEGVCVTCENDYTYLHEHYRHTPSHKPQEWDECWNCGERFDHLGQHWIHNSSCEHPPLTEYQYEVTVGMLMGDGSIYRSNGNRPYLQTNMITKEYLEYVDDIFGAMSTGVKFALSAEDNVKASKRSGLNDDAHVDDYHDVYGWRTRSSPVFDEFKSWYDSGEKVWPDDIELTPTVLKHWYCGDGHYDGSSGGSGLSIGLSNEINSRSKVNSYFERVGMPQANRWKITNRGDGSKMCQAVWNRNEAHSLWEYMLSDGRGIPNGFEYKWPVEYR